MRLRILSNTDIDGNGLYLKTKETLVSEIGKDDGFILTDENPDVVHIIGAWDNHAVKIANDAIKRHIAWVYTPAGALSPWYKPTSSHSKLSFKASATISSGAMEQELLSGQDSRKLHLILNAVTTATTTQEEMATQYKEVYKLAFDNTDEALWEEVNKRIGMLKEKDESILEISRNLLYAQYLSVRGNIPQKFLNKLSALMTDSNYNEDTMAEVLKLINIDIFTQHLEYVMMEKSELTEGFMPIIYKKDSTSEKMISIVTDY